MPKTKRKALLDNKTLGRIHVAKRDLGLSDDDYRALLERVCGVRSAADVTPDQVPALQRELRRIGWPGYLKPFIQDYKHDNRTKYEELAGRNTDQPSPKQLRMLEAMFKNVRGYGDVSPDNAFRRFLEQRFGVSHPKFLDNQQYERALAAVRALQQRNGVKDESWA